MSNKLKTLVITLLFIIFFSAGVILTYFYLKKDTKNAVINNNVSDINDNNKYTEDNLKFKSEYEGLNDDLDEDGNKKYVEVSIPENNLIKYTTAEEIKSLFENNKSAIIYLGFESCPWCRNAVPVLIDACKENNASEIYYMNIKDIRDKKILDENKKVVTENEGTEEYKTILDLFKDDIDVYDGLNDNSIKRIYAPTVYFIKDGKIVKKHVSTVDSQENPKEKLTDEQTNELKNIYKDGITKMSLNDQNQFVCDEDRNC